LTEQELTRLVAAELRLGDGQVARTIQLLDEGNTIPFVARYRKEMTGSLDEEQLRSIEARVGYLRKLEQRKETVRKSIEEQGKLTDELDARIKATQVLQELEDLYLPYKPKRRTRATVARERGLEPLANMIREQRIVRGEPLALAEPYVNDEVPTPEDALAGASDIVAEWAAEDSVARAHCRQVLTQSALLVSRLAKGAEDQKSRYQDYYDYAERLANMPPHRVLAVNRGERDKVLRVEIQIDDETILAWLDRHFVTNAACVFLGYLRGAIADGWQRLMLPALEREVRAAKTEAAERHAISVFGRNLKSLLLQPPIANRRVLALDPGFRTGCKAAAVDETGRFLESATIYPHPPQNQAEAAKWLLRGLIDRLGIRVIAIGNGTASRETEALAAEMIAEGAPVQYVMVSEAGASIYSASKLAGEELPGLDVTIRGAVSIARRLQDPLAELVKIGAQHVGVGLYQHDVDQTALGAALDGVVESAVNYVGVDLATASPALLQYVSGLTARTAKAVVAYRDEQGAFRSRQELLRVKGLGAKAFEQAAGFMRIAAGENPLDNTSIHPESYGVCGRFLALLGADAREPDLPNRVREGWQRVQAEGETVTTVAKVLGIGAPTLQDILDNLLKPGRDPRSELPAPILRQDILKMEDLQEGMMLTGTVRNVVDFGAFVDIGVKQDGLVHISQLADRFVEQPLDVVSVGDIVQVRVISVDAERLRIGLSLKSA
jgi:uncharacterized protein